MVEGGRVTNPGRRRKANRGDDDDGKRNCDNNKSILEHTPRAELFFKSPHPRIPASPQLNFQENPRRRLGN